MSEVEVKIGKDLVAPIIQAKIHSAIVSALADGGSSLVEDTVATLMSQRVDKDDGKVSSYGSAIPRIEYLSTKMLEEATKNAIKKWAEENKKQIEAAMYSELSKRSQTSRLVKAILNGLVESTKSSWRFDVNFKFDRE